MIRTGDKELEGFDIKDDVKMFKEGKSAAERPPRPPTYGGVIRKQKAKEATAAKKAIESRKLTLETKAADEKDEQPAMNVNN